MLRRRPGKLNRNGLGSLPKRRDADRRRLPFRLRHRHRQRRLAEHDPDRLIASAMIWSLLGRARSLARVSSSSVR